MQGFGPFINMPNNMNNYNAWGITNQIMPQSLIAGDWSQMYTSNQPNFNTQNNDNSNNKITVVFKTGRGVITTIYIDHGKTVSYLIQVYFKRVGKPELFKKPLEIGFLYNAHLINFNESQLVENFFKGISYVTITVNDIGDLIGAKIVKII